MVIVTEVRLKTPSDFQSPSNLKERQSSTEFDGNKMSACFANILEKITIKQIMGNFAEAFCWNNQARKINKISDEIWKKLEIFKQSHSAVG